jgi:hypothetical protein
VRKLWGCDPPTVRALSDRYTSLKKLAAEYENSGGMKTPTAKNGGLVTPSSSPKTGVKRLSSAPEPLATRRTKRRATQNVKYELESSGESEEDFPSGDDSSEDEYVPEELMQAGPEMNDVKEEMTPEMEENGDRVSSEIKALGKELQERTTSPVKVEVKSE